MNDSAESFADAVSRRRIGGICSVLGWQSIQSSALHVMSDFLRMYVQAIGRSTKENAEVCSRTEVNLRDLDFTFRQMGISPAELEDYVLGFGSTSLDTTPVAQFPKPSEIKLNFLKPGSREVLHRKTHVFEYLPPMYPEMEMADSPPPIAGGGGGGGDGSPSEGSAGMSDARGAGGSSEQLLAEADSTSNYPDSLPVREISSVIMTSAGFISPAREGKLPESRTPATVSTKEALSKKHASLTSMPPPQSMTMRDHGGHESPRGRPAKDKKLSVFKKKVPKGPSPEKPSSSSSAHDHTDDVINSVIERGVIESESFEIESKFSSSSSSPSPKKRKKYEHKQEAKQQRLEAKAAAKLDVRPPKPETAKQQKFELKKTKDEPVLLLPPPPPAEVMKPYLSENPLIPKQLYGFGIEPEPERAAELSNNPFLPFGGSSSSQPAKSEGKSKDKSMKKKRAKKERERRDSSSEARPSKRDKKEKKKKLEKSEKSEKTPKTGVKIKFKDSSLETPPSLPSISTKVVLKVDSSISAVKLPKHSKPQRKYGSAPMPDLPLFQDTIKIDHGPIPSTSSSSSTITSFHASLAQSDETPKRKRGRPEKKDKEKEKPKKKKDDAEYEGGCITTQTVGHYIDAEGNQIWICPTCSKQDDGSPMIGCDSCDDWYHWMCVGIQQEPEESQNWFCQRCVAKKGRGGAGPTRKSTR